MELVSICSSSGALYGLDATGQVWYFSNTQNIWKKMSMSTEGCPKCGNSRDNPEQYLKADGYGGLNRFCEHVFHE